MVIEWMAAKTARVIKEADPERTASKEVLEYGLKIIYNAGSIIFISLAIGILSGKFIDTLIGLIAFALFRFITGGYHVKSSDYCVLISTLIMVAIPHIILNHLSLVIVNSITLILTAIFAPSNIQAQVNFPKRYNLWLKFIAFTIVLINLIFLKSNILSVTFFVQSLTLIKFKGDN